MTREHQSRQRHPHAARKHIVGMVAGSVAAVAVGILGLQFGLSTAFANGDVCDLCSTNYDPVACCSSGGSAYDSNPGGGIDVSAQKAAFDSYCANYKKAQNSKPVAGNTAVPSAKSTGSSNSSSTTKSGITTQGSTSKQQSTTQGAASNGQAQPSSNATTPSSGATGAVTTQPESSASATASTQASKKSGSAPSTTSSAGASGDSGSNTGAGTSAVTNSSGAAANQSGQTADNPGLRIAAGAVIALAIAGTIAAAIIIKRRREASAQVADGASSSAADADPTNFDEIAPPAAADAAIHADAETSVFPVPIVPEGTAPHHDSPTWPDADNQSFQHEENTQEGNTQQ